MENLISKALEKAFEMRQNYVNESPSHIFNCYPYCWGLKVRDFDLFFCLSNVSGKFFVLSGYFRFGLLEMEFFTKTSFIWYVTQKILILKIN